MNADQASCFRRRQVYSSLVSLMTIVSVSCDRNSHYVLHSPLKVKTASGLELTLPAGTYVETRMIKGHQVEVLASGTALDSEVEKAGDRK